MADTEAQDKKRAPATGGQGSAPGPRTSSAGPQDAGRRMEEVPHSSVLIPPSSPLGPQFPELDGAELPQDLAELLVKTDRLLESALNRGSGGRDQESGVRRNGSGF